MNSKEPPGLTSQLLNMFELSIDGALMRPILKVHCVSTGYSAISFILAKVAHFCWLYQSTSVSKT